MTTMTETPAPAARTNPLTLQRQAVIDAANAPKPTWQPAPLRPPPHPAVVALREKADAIRADAAATATTADSMTQAANAVGQRIASLEGEKTGLVARLANIPNDLKAMRESARGTIHRLYGRTALDHAERESLNSASLALAWTKEIEKELPIIKKDLQARLEEINAELETLTASK